eukprot:UN17915
MTYSVEAVTFSFFVVLFFGAQSGNWPVSFVPVALADYDVSPTAIGLFIYVLIGQLASSSVGLP